mgnify:CR=1 FL=1
MGFRRSKAEPTTSSRYTKIWLLALAGLVVPAAIKQWRPEAEWVREAEKSHRLSLREGGWQEPWQPIGTDRFSSSWIRCSSLDHALSLDRRIDDGNLYTGRLVLSEGGLAWLGP